MTSRPVLAVGVLPFLAVLLIGTTVAAEDPPGTQATLAQLGAKVRITTVEPTSATSDQPSRVIGTLVEADGDGLTVLRKEKEDRVRIPRSAIQKLEVGRGTTRGRRALIGAGVGAALGLAVAAIDYSNCEEGDWCELVWGLPVLTTPVGAVLGLATGGQRWVEASPPRVAFSIRPARRGVQLACSITF